MKILFSGDQHFNHPKLDPSFMAGSYLRVLKSSIVKYKPDVLLLGGDWFDRPTTFTSKAGVVILMLMNTIVVYCIKYNIKLRVLKGTGTHDGSQNDTWSSIADGRKGLDFRLYKEVDIVNDLGMTILTIPDSTISDHAKCELEVRSKLATNNLNSVQLAFTHGIYDHHVKALGVKLPCHSTDYYNSIIDIVALNSHIHTKSLAGRILTGCSSDRLRHGEEDPKGIHLITIDKQTNSFEATFIENTDAAIFKTFRVNKGNLDYTIDDVTKYLADIDNAETYIRLLYNEDVNIRPTERQLSDKFPNVRFTPECNGKSKESYNIELANDIIGDIPEGITPDTLEGLYLDKFKRMDLPFTSKHIEVIKEIVDAVK